MNEWRWIDGATEPVVRDGASNMALDHSLFESVKAGGPSAFRLYRWSPACLSFGRNQPARGAYDEAAAAAEGIEFVRRPTGGQAVLHDRELTYAVALPLGELGSPRDTYIAIHEALVSGLRALGAAVATRPYALSGPRTLDEWSRPCFAGAARGEVVANGRKLVGSAQRCESHCVLQHGSILLDGDQSAVSRLQKDPVGIAAVTPPITLTDLLDSPLQVPELAAALGAGLASALGIALAPDTLSEKEMERVQELTLHYRSAAWTWRR
jgi:lipoyl(octanoyl) transferase